MEYMFEIFLTILLMVLGLGLLVAGLFTVYFGSGKSRGIGAGLLVGGIVIGALVAFLYYNGTIDLGRVNGGLWLLWWVIQDALVYLIAALAGGLAAIGMFLLAIMKS
jgi:hypothetical protein